MFVIVLNDGETFSELSGTRIIEVPEDVHREDLDEWVKDAYEMGQGVPLGETAVKKAMDLETLIKKALEKKS